MHNCGSAGMGGFGNAQFAVIQVPFSLVGSGGSGGGTGTGGGAVGTAPGIAYVPPAGSVLTGATDAGKAFDKIGELLKLLNNAGFTAGNTGTIPVYDAVTGKFIPTAPSDILDDAAMAALLKDLYASGAAGSILQKQPDGSIAAITFPNAIKAGFPTATTGQVLKYNGTTWVAAVDDIGASLGTTIAALTPGVPIKLAGVDSTGAAVSATPSAVLAAATTGAPSATQANPLKLVSGLDAAGNPVKTVAKLMGETTTVVISAATAGTTLVASESSSAYPVIASVTAPRSGFYAISINVVVLSRIATTPLVPMLGRTGVARIVSLINSEGVQLHNSGSSTEESFTTTFPVGGTCGNHHHRGVKAMAFLTSGQVVELQVIQELQSASGTITGKLRDDCSISLHYLGNVALGV